MKPDHLAFPTFSFVLLCNFVSTFLDARIMVSNLPNPPLVTSVIVEEENSGKQNTLVTVYSCSFTWSGPHMGRWLLAFLAIARPGGTGCTWGAQRRV